MPHSKRNFQKVTENRHISMHLTGKGLEKKKAHLQTVKNGRQNQAVRMQVGKAGKGVLITMAPRQWIRRMWLWQTLAWEPTELSSRINRLRSLSLY